MNSLAYTIALPTFSQEARTTSAYYALVNVDEHLNKLEQIAYECEENDTGLNSFRQVFLNYRDESRYDQILHESINYSTLLQCYILYTLATISYDGIKNSEEQYTLRQLETNNLTVQEAALGTLIDWNKTRELDQLKHIKINDRYLQRDLAEFVGRLEDTQ